MKKILSVFLAVAMLLSICALVACSSDDKSDDITTTTEKAEDATTTLAPPPAVTGDDDDDDETEITLVGLPENGDFIPWKYHVEAVDYLKDDKGITDYIRMGDGGDGFAAFVASNPKWNTVDFDDSDWDSHDEPGDLGANVGYDGINHGLFVRAKFDLTDDQYNKIKSGDAGVYLFAKYDNTFHVYVNGVQIFADDGSWQFQEGKEGASVLSIKDWTDGAYKAIPVAYDASYENGKEIQGDLTAADILHAGTNVVACSLKDAWGGREFGADLFYTTDVDW